MESPQELIELMVSNTLSLSDVYDRFSDLPEAIILHVFSFLDYNDIVHLSSVSRNFRKICLCCPNLLFKLAFDNKKCTANCKKFQRFLKDFLDLHKAQEIHRLGLHWFCHSKAYDSRGSIFPEWVQKALRNKVQELDIAVPVTTDHKPFKFPGGRDQFKSLRALKLKLKGGKSNLLALKLPSLEALSLTSVSVDDRSKFGEWVSNSCKSLEVLNLEEFSDIHYLNITSLSAMFLEMGASSSVVPPLRSYQLPSAALEGSIPSINLPNSLSLRDAVISLEPSTSFFGLHEYSIFTHNGLVTLIDGVRHAKSLQLNFQIIEALSQHDQLPEFKRLEHLEVAVAELNLDNIATLAAFLVELCSLNTLTLRFKENATQLSEAEVANEICSEVEKHGVDSNYLKMKIICSAIENKEEQVLGHT
ncbi:hypothetical protein CCACVL1_13865 [Corchorus capsularis]|uniref:F-box domain-containing protein n=1 Tax=Corchorus capsularis TaxID=210143 RepID=A0A1R3I9G1_COCAP|nr:hypothetical protein CCACVL1_13865 [Corchorus capsularis]